MYLRLCEKVRPEGSKKAVKRILYNIGPLHEVTDGKPDFVERLRQSFKDGDPILPELKAFVREGTETGKTVLLPFPLEGEGPDGVFSIRLCADMLFDAYMKELGLTAFFTCIRRQRKLDYDLPGFVKRMVYGLILDPDSSVSVLSQNDRYFHKILEEGCDPFRIFDALDILHQYRDSVFRTMSRAMRSRKAYESLSQTGNCFRSPKGSLGDGPIDLSSPEYMDGYRVACDIALTIDRLIQEKTKWHLESGSGETEEMSERVRNALNAFQAETLPQGFLRFRSMSEDQAGRDLQMILKAHGIRLEGRIFKREELHMLSGLITAL